MKILKNAWLLSNIFLCWLHIHAGEAERGSYAAKSGRDFEAKVQEKLATCGFSVERYSAWKKKPVPVGEGDLLLLRHVPFENIYGTRSYTEFLLKAPGVMPDVRIECKFQKVSGSVDEKFPYVFLNALDAMPESIVIVVVEGQGFRPKAVEWLRHVAQEQTKKTILVMNMPEFEAWAEEHFPIELPGTGP